MKTCAKCKIEKSFDKFNKKTKSKDGLQDYCRFCSNEYKKKWRKENSDSVKKYNNNFRKNNKKYYANKQKQWRKRNPEKVRAMDFNRRARELKAIGIVTVKVIKELYFEQSGLCAYCGIRVFDDYHVDHMVPLVNGGSNLKENLCISCPDCNLSKNSKTMNEWIEYSGFLFKPTDYRNLKGVI